MKLRLTANGKTIKLEANTKPELIAMAKDYCEKNNINFAENIISAHIDAQNATVKKPSNKVGILDAFNGARAILRYVSGESTTPSEMIRRAKICEGCEKLSAISGCAACGAGRRIANIVNTIRAHKKSEVEVPRNVQNKYCGICSCSIPMMVLTKYKDFYRENETKNNSRPDNCWLKESSPNFTNE
jgi:hypothetical protein